MKNSLPEYLMYFPNNGCLPRRVRVLHSKSLEPSIRHIPSPVSTLLSEFDYTDFPVSNTATIKSVLEALQPIPPYLRWEAHSGSPVSTLCALDKTPLLATASTDSTVRLFTLADIQVT